MNIWFPLQPGKAKRIGKINSSELPSLIKDRHLEVAILDRYENDGALGFKVVKGFNFKVDDSGNELVVQKDCLISLEH